MVNMPKITSLIVRQLKILSVCVLCGAIFFDTITGSDAYRKRFGHMLVTVPGVIAITCGLINTILTKPKTAMGDNHVLWSNLVKIKFFLALGLTPLLDKLMTSVNMGSDIANVRFVICLVVLLMSAFMKVYREANLAKRSP